MSEKLIKYISSKPEGSMYKPEVALGVKIQNYGPTSTTHWWNTLEPDNVGQYGLVKATGTESENLESWRLNSDSELIELINEQAGGGITTINQATQWASSEANYMLTSNINTTGSTDVLPFAVWDSYSSYSSTNKWYSTACPLGLKTNKQHALSEYIAMRTVNGVKYAAPYPGTRIWEINGTSVTEIVTSTSTPESGTINVTENRRYVANKPIHLARNGQQEIMIPSSYCGTQHANYFNRYEPGKIRIYTLEDDTVVKIYRRDDTEIDPRWLWDNPTTTLNISSKYVVTVHTFDTTLDDGVWNYIFSSKPIVITSTGNDLGDKTFTPLAGDIIYQQRNHINTDMNGGISSFSGNAFCRYKDNFTYKVATIQIADGSGGDALSGVPTIMINKNYTFGNQLSDFHIVSGHSTNTIKISSYNDTDGWTLHETIIVTGGTETAPVSVCRDGAQGFGNPCTNDSGGAIYFNSDQLWLWEGTKTFFCSINDAANDEEALLGWDSGEIMVANL